MRIFISFILLFFAPIPAMASWSSGLLGGSGLDNYSCDGGSTTPRQIQSALLSGSPDGFISRIQARCSISGSPVFGVFQSGGSWKYQGGYFPQAYGDYTWSGSSEPSLCSPGVWSDSGCGVTCWDGSTASDLASCPTEPVGPSDSCASLSDPIEVLFCNAGMSVLLINILVIGLYIVGIGLIIWAIRIVKNASSQA